MVEVELKFQVPAAARAGVGRALATATARTVELQAVYFDTADDRLANAGFALRIRREGRRWVQTLKARGDGMLQRPEHEVELPPQRGTPAPELARHAGTPPGDALAALLADGAPLQPRYRTAIRRRLRRVRHAGALIEVAFDEGRIEAGARRLPVNEVEFELVSGPPAALPALAERWVKRHRLWLDVRTKAERGHRLALGRDAVDALKASPITLPDDATPGQAFAAMLQAGLAHLLPNAAEVTGGSAAPEHLHQVRVALRRLRTALRVFAAWSPDPAAAHALEDELRGPFAELGAARDVDALEASLLPALAAAGGPPMVLPAPASARDPATILRDPTFTVPVLRTLQLALHPPAAAGRPLAEAAHAVLALQWRRLRADAKAFADAAPPERHRTRRRLKRLRYASEFLQPVLPRKAAARALAAMRLALDALGEYNDALIASGHFRDLAATEPRAWFAVGWLTARDELLLQAAVRRLKALRSLASAWT